MSQQFGTGQKLFIKSIASNPGIESETKQKKEEASDTKVIVKSDTQTKVALASTATSQHSSEGLNLGSFVNFKS